MITTRRLEGRRTAMKGMRSGWRIGFCVVLCVAVIAPVRSAAAAGHPARCRKILLTGEVNAGQEWKAAFGEGWMFRVVPIQPGKEGYSGWDLVVDRNNLPDILTHCWWPRRRITPLVNAR